MFSNKVTVMFLTFQGSKDEQIWFRAKLPVFRSLQILCFNFRFLDLNSKRFFQPTCKILFPPTRFGPSKGHLQGLLIYWSQLASSCIVPVVVYQIIIWLKTLVVSLSNFLKSLKEIKILSLLVVVLNSIKWCKLKAKSSIFVALLLFIMYVSLCVSQLVCLRCAVLLL